MIATQRVALPEITNSTKHACLECELITRRSTVCQSWLWNRERHARQGIDAVYDHSERREEKRSALERWAQHLAGIINPAANVLPFPKAAAAQ